MLLPPPLIECQQLGSAHCHNHTVDRLPWAVLTQELQERDPARGVRGLVRVLRRIAARRVEKDGLIGEPPVTTARAPNTTQRLLAKLLGEGKVQSRVHQHGGLARAGRSDDHVPRQIVETRTVTPRLERLQSLVEALGKLRGLTGSGAGALHVRCRTGLFGDFLGKTLVVLCVAHLSEQHVERVQRHENENRDQAFHDSLERLGVAKGEIRPGEPDDERQEQQPEGDQHGAVSE